MLGWKINSKDLERELGHVMGREVTAQELSSSLLIAARIAREQANDDKLDRNEFYQAVSDARFEALNNGYHYITNQSPILGSSTVLAIDNLLHPRLKKKEAKPNYLNRVPIIHDASQWSEFLTSLRLPSQGSWGRFLSSANHYVGNVGIGFNEILGHGAALLTDPGEKVDMRFNTLLEKATKVAMSIREPRNGRREKIGQMMARRGFDRPPSAEYVAGALKIIQTVLSDCDSDRQMIDRMQQMPFARTALETVLCYIMAYGKQRNSRDAIGALLAIRTELYSRRAKLPIGMPTDNFPALDSHDRGQVLTFLRDRLKMPIREEDEDIVWERWKVATDSDVTPEFFPEMDLDKTTFEYKLNLWTGKEKVHLRLVVVSLVALALKFKKSIPIASHTSLGRIADILNCPQLAALKFAYALRMPEDPPVTQEEVAGMKTDKIFFESLTYTEVNVLKSIEQKVNQGESLNELEMRVFYRTYYMLRSLSILIRGHKDVGIMQMAGKKSPMSILIDDTRAEQILFQSSGGQHGARPHKKMSKLSEFNELPAEELNVFDAYLTMVKSLKEGSQQQLHLRVRDYTFDDAAFIKHKEWGLKVVYGWLKPLMTIVGAKIKFRWNFFWKLKKNPKKDILEAITSFVPDIISAIKGVDESKKKKQKVKPLKSEPLDLASPLKLPVVERYLKKWEFEANQKKSVWRFKTLEDDTQAFDPARRKMGGTEKMMRLSHPTRAGRYIFRSAFANSRFQIKR